ncbi:uncharacterized protein HaLaN_02566, partial [Haematococcus lacustris]
VDLEASLTVRMELMVEDALNQEAAEQEAEQGSGQASGQLASKQPLLVEGGLAKPWSLRLPRRVCLPWQAGLPICDYLVAGEDTLAAVERGKELMGL